MTSRESLVSKLRKTYLNRGVDKDYLVFEEEMTSLQDLESILIALDKKIQLPNPYNSCLLYETGLSNEFDFERERADTKGGSPPDKLD